MKYHILNGDALAEKFPTDEISGEIVVISEAFIEGPLSTEFSNEYWDKRAEFIFSAYGGEKEDYESQFLSQLRILDTIRPEDEVCLWFEDDLFCQANMWFAIYYISLKTKAKFLRVFPNDEHNHWAGFGRAQAKDLIDCFNASKEFPENEIALAINLWKAYVQNDQYLLQTLSASDVECFRFLKDVVHAHLERTAEDGGPGRPQRTLIDILNRDVTNFYEICDEFWKTESIYGFGDLQVYNMLKEMEVEFSGELDPFVPGS